MTDADPVAAAWRVLKTHAEDSPDLWNAAYRTGLEASFRLGDFKAGVGLAILAAGSLESHGQVGSAIAHINDALALFAADQSACARLLSRRAVFEALASLPEAPRTMRLARRGIRALDRDSVLDLNVYAVVLDSIQLNPRCILGAERISVSNEEEPPSTLVTGTKPWVITAMHAFGMAERSEIWITSLGAYAEAAHDVFRKADVAALDFATRARQRLVEVDEHGLAGAPRNTIARWHVGVTTLYLSLLRRDHQAAAHAIGALEALGERMNPSWRSGLPAYRSALNAWFEDGPESPLPAPPDVVSAITLPAALAGLNASSQAGSQDDAVLWRRWADASLPPHIQSSLGWPVSVDRLIALSDVRLGRVGNARRRFERAIRWADAGGYAFERAIALVQLAELATLASLPTTRERWQALRRQGRSELTELGLDPDPLAYQVARALALGRTSDFAPKLTPREVEVLALLARGLTHREVGANLGISWRTAQVHAASAYGKLDANTRIAAITKARELGLLA